MFNYLFSYILVFITVFKTLSYVFLFVSFLNENKKARLAVTTFKKVFYCLVTLLRATSIAQTCLMKTWYTITM